MDEMTIHVVVSDVGVMGEFYGCIIARPKDSEIWRKQE